MMADRASLATCAMLLRNMRPRKYALETLARLRAAKADEAARDLAAAIGEREHAERRRLAAELLRVEHDAAAQRLLDAERDSLGRGELSAGDLARVDAWQIRVGSDREALGSAVDRALTELARAASKEEGVSAELAKRHADSKIVINDRERWRERLRATGEAQDDEAASESWRPMRGQ